MNKTNFAKRVSNWKHCIQLHFFQGNQLWCVPLCPRRLLTWLFLLTAAAGTFSLPASQYIFTAWTVFLTQLHHNKPRFSLFINFFLTKKWFSIHITQSSVNFAWFALCPQPKIWLHNSSKSIEDSVCHFK